MRSWINRNEFVTRVYLFRVMMVGLATAWSVDAAMVASPSSIRLENVDVETGRRFQFTLTNRSEETTRIQKIVSHCGCTKLEWDEKKAVMQPGDEIPVKCVFQPTKDRGVQTTQIDVVYQIGDLRTYTTVPVYASVLYGFHIRPVCVYVEGKREDVLNSRFTLSLFGASAKDTRVTGVRSTHPNIIPEYIPQTVAGNPSDKFRQVTAIWRIADEPLSMSEGITSATVEIEYQTEGDTSRIWQVPVEINL